jgi:putative ABC transport system substrate-binding protein
MPHHFSTRFLTIVAFVVIGLFQPLMSAAQTATVAVIYPDLQEPYRSVVSSIIEGIQEKIKEPVKLFPLGDDAKPEQLKSAIDPEHIGAIIALGRSGLAAAQQWQGEIPIVVGALLLTPDKKDRGIAGISLAADPEEFFTYLEQLAPAVKRVHVVYSPQNSAWLIQAAKGSANNRNFQLIAYKSADIKSSALIYRDIINKSRPGEDAIWLLPDPVAVDDRVILPLLLRGAWDQNILVFSSNPAHVRRGALFALFPENKEMGKSLAKMTDIYVKERMTDIYVKGGEEPLENNIVPLRDLQAAINVRTAEHIGLSISDEQRQKFSLVFPAP